VWAELQDVTSNVLHIQVISPSPEERMIAEEIVKKLGRWKSKSQAIEDAKALIQRYPHTVYLPNIYGRLLSLLNASDRSTDRTEELMKYSLQLLEKFPDNGGAILGLETYVVGLRRKLGCPHPQSVDSQQAKAIQDELTRINARFPNVRMNRLVDEMIKDYKQR
jgi:hypothetical protein